MSDPDLLQPRQGCQLLIPDGNIYAAHYGLGPAVIYPLWTLSIEEQFYAVVPALAKCGGVRLLRGASIALIVLAYAVLVYFGRAQHVEGQNELVSFNSLVQFQFLRPARCWPCCCMGAGGSPASWHGQRFSVCPWRAWHSALAHG